MDEITLIDGVLITSLKIIPNTKGDIFHALRKDSNGFREFGEAYFSSIKYNEVKAWKLHKLMTLNLVVPIGSVKFVLFDERQNSKSYQKFNEFILSTEKYSRLTVPPNIWMGFKGLSEGLNLILNIADIVHAPDEQINIDPTLSSINYKW